jgi:membrane fusion protein (multidrug efflux system)
VGSREVSIGDYVSVGEALVRVEDLSNVKVEFYVSQRYVQRIAIGQRVRVSVEPLPEKYEGTVYLIDPRVDADTRSAVVRGKVPNPGEVLRPGMFCTASIIIEEKKNALLVPEEAVLSRGDKRFLFVEKDGKAAIRAVRLGLSAEGRVEVVEGLQPRARVVAAGSQKLFTDTPIVEYKPGARRPGKKAEEGRQG